MAGFIQNIIWNSVEGFVEAGTRTAGEYAGNALIKAGDMIENGGRGVGNSIEKKATGYGSTISGQTYKTSPKALPSTARKPVVKRSNSLPANTKPSYGSVKSTPLGANKYPGGNQVNGAKKAVTGGANSARSTIGSVTGGATKTLGGVTGGVAGGAGNARKSLPKPFPNSTNSLPKPYNTSAFGAASDRPKTAVKPGQPKPFVPPTEQKKSGDAAKKPYPGTNTLPGQGSKVPVQNQRLKPLPRLGPQVKQGQQMTHLAV